MKRLLEPAQLSHPATRAEPPASDMLVGRPAPTDSAWHAEVSVTARRHNAHLDMLVGGTQVCQHVLCHIGCIDQGLHGEEVQGFHCCGLIVIQLHRSRGLVLIESVQDALERSSLHLQRQRSRDGEPAEPAAALLRRGSFHLSGRRLSIGEPPAQCSAVKVL